MITKGEIIFGIGGLAIGFLAGYGISRKVTKGEKEDRIRFANSFLEDETAVEEDTQEDSSNEFKEVSEDKEDNEIVKKRYEDMLSDLLYETDESNINPDSVEDESDAETFTDDVTGEEVTIKEDHSLRKRPPYIVSDEEEQQAESEEGYPVENLYFFIGSDLLTNEYGDPVKEYDAIGNEPRKKGFMKEDPFENTLGNYIWVKNERRRMIYHIERREESARDTDLFPYDEDDYE